VRRSSQRSVDEALQRRFGLVGNALSEIPEPQAFRPYDGTAKRPVDAGEEPQERRLPRAVGAHEADAFAVVKNSTKTREYFARPIVTFEIGKPQQFHAEPYICARLARRPSRPVSGGHPSRRFRYSGDHFFDAVVSEIKK
jgi:hypothetical protein